MTQATDAAAAPRVGARAWYTLGILFLVYTLHYVDRSVLAVTLEPIKREFSLSDSQLGVLTGFVYALTYAAAGIPFGMLIDRVNRRNLLAIVLTVWSSATVLCGMASSYGALVASRFVVGGAEAGGSPTSMSIIADLFPGRLRATALGIYWMSTAVGSMLMFAAGGFLVAAYGWRTTFMIAGGPGLVLVAILLLTVREPKRGASDLKTSDETAPSLMEAFRFGIRRPPVVFMFLGMSCASIVGSGMYVWVASFYLRIYDLPLTKAGLIAGLTTGIVGTFGNYLGGAGADRAARRGAANIPLVPAIFAPLGTLGGIIMATGTTVWIGVLGFVIFEMFYRTYFGPGYATLGGQMPPRMRGLTFSTMQMASNLIGWGAGPFIIGHISDIVGGHDSLRAGIAAVSSFNLLAALFYFLSWRASKRMPPEY